MHASPETLDKFITKRQVRQVEAANPEVARLQKISRQVLRASKIAKRGYFEDTNGDGVFYGSRWTNLAYDAENDVITQARLHGIFDRRLWVLPGRTACVHLYLRGADTETITKPQAYYADGDTEYYAIFDPDYPEIRVPDENHENPHWYLHDSGGDIVVPDTPKWRELDYILGQIEARPR